MRDVGRLLPGLAALAILALAGCSGSPSMPRPAPSPRPVINLSWADEGHTLTVPAGQRIAIYLNGQSCTPTTVPVARDPSVLRTLALGSADGNSWARFQAVAVGRTQITATHGDTCSGGESSFKTEEFLVTVDIAA